MNQSHQTAWQFGEYQVLRLIARGGMGAVYEAEHLRFGNRVALKLIDRPLSEDSVETRRFLREGRTLDSIRHANVVRVFEAGFEGKCPFIAMELVRGETLRAKLDRGGPLARSELVELFVPICDAIATIHDAGILHRDLKLCNVMLTERAGKTEPVVLDFGIAKDAVAAWDETVLTHSQGILGTPRYLSPEQLLNPKASSPLSDQYAVGVMLYECAAARSPFSGEGPYGLMSAILNAEAEPPSTRRAPRDAELDAVILRAMARDPAARFADMRALGAALRALSRAELRTARPPAPSVPCPTAERTEVETARSSAPWPRPAGTDSPPTLEPAPSRRFARDATALGAQSARPQATLAETTGFHEIVPLDAVTVVVRRSGREFVDADEIGRERLRIGLVLDGIGRARKRLLVDSRQAPMSTDERLAAAFLALREEIGRGFERTAVLVGSKVGILQANRLNNATTMDGALAAFDDEQRALEFLRR